MSMPAAALGAKGIAGIVVSVVVGAGLAATTVVGLVNSQVNSSAAHPGSTSKSNITYGD